MEIDLSRVDAQQVDSHLTLTLSSINDVENVIGSAGDDTIHGNELDNVIAGGPGDDTMTGDYGDDTYLLEDGWGIDAIVEGGQDEGYDTIDFSDVTSNVSVMQLEDGSFTFGDDTNDLAFDNVEVLVGGSGTNALDFSAASDAVVVNLAGGVSTDFAELSGFSNVVGSAFGDTLIGNDLANSLRGGPGNDVITGGAGADVIAGGDGSDSLVGSRDVSFTLTNVSLIATGGDIVGSEIDTLSEIEFATLNGGATRNVLDASAFHTMTPTTPLAILNGGAGVDVDANDLVIRLTNNTTVPVDLVGATTIQDVLDAIEDASGSLTATVDAAGSAIVIVDSTGDTYDLRASSMSSLAADLGIAKTGTGERWSATRARAAA